MRIYPRGKIYWCDYSDVNGQRVQRSLKIKDARLARIAAGKIEERLERQRAGLDLATPDDAWESRIIRVQAETAESTKRRTLPILAALREWFGSNLTARRVHEYVAHRKGQGIAVSTINYEVSQMRGLLPPAERAKVRPLRDRDMAAHEEKARYLSREEVRTLEAGCPGDLLPHVRAFLRLGCRLNELLSIEWRHVTPAGVRIDNPKTVRSASTSHRVVPLHPELEGDLERSRAAGLPRPWHWDGTDRTLAYHVTAVCARLGIGHVTPKIFRRTFATHLIPEVGIYAVSKLLGHSTVEQTARAYAWLLPESAEKVKGLRY